MCGRFTIMLDADELKETLELGNLPEDWRPRFNVAPTQPVAVVADAVRRNVEWMRWGLIPSWAKDVEIGNRLINARSETVTEKPSFRKAFLSRRCIILADGFYEWKKQEGKKSAAIPYHFHKKDRSPFGLAGLWEIWRSPEGQDIRSCTILTTRANGVVLPVHERMPVILDGEDMWRWVAAGSPESHLGLLRPYPEEYFESTMVSTKVNSPGLDAPDCAAAIAG